MNSEGCHKDLGGAPRSGKFIPTAAAEGDMSVVAGRYRFHRKGGFDNAGVGDQQAVAFAVTCISVLVIKQSLVDAGFEEANGLTAMGPGIHKVIGPGIQF